MIVAALRALAIVWAGVGLVLFVCLLCAGTDWLMGDEDGE